MHLALALRTATAADRDELDGVYRRASLHGEADREALLEHPELFVLGTGVEDGRTRVAVAAGRIVGFATLSAPSGDAAELEVELDDLFVDPPAMRAGVATRLVDDAVELARARGCRAVVVTANEQARAFYARVGFVQDGIAATALGPAPRMRLAVPPPRASSPRRAP